MTLAHKARAMLKGLAKFGEPSFLAGAECGKVAIERNASMYAGIGDTADDNPMVRYTLATLDRAAAPKRGQLLEHPTEGAFTLDRLMVDNGYTARFVVNAAEAPPRTIATVKITQAAATLPLLYAPAGVIGTPAPVCTHTWVFDDAAAGALVAEADGPSVEVVPASGQALRIQQVWENAKGSVTVDSAVAVVP